MTYYTIAAVTQVASLLFFFGMFIAVIAYAFWPGNRDRFEDAQRKALDLNTDARQGGGKP